MTSYVPVSPYEVDWSYTGESEAERETRIESSAWYTPFKPTIDGKRAMHSIIQEYGPTQGARVSDQLSPDSSTSGESG